MNQPAPRDATHANQQDDHVDSRAVDDSLVDVECTVVQPTVLEPTFGDAEGTIEDTLTESGSSTPALSSRLLPRPFGDYMLLGEIARGGMGVVYKARQVKADRIVALKMILSGNLAGDEEVGRFYTEAEAAANLDHPNIVPVYDVGELDGQHYFSMGFVEGRSLKDRIRRGPLSSREAVELLKPIAEAIAYAHQVGVIHRDLKPANVLLDLDGRPRVTDFGLARRLEGDSDLTATGQIMGTPSYMPPEQAAGKVDQIGPLSDVYSLGAILYEVVTGRPPFQAASVFDVLTAVLQHDPVPPRTLNPAIGRDLETTCLKCLEKDPKRRYESAQALADELGRLLNREPIRARPVSTSERTWRWCVRNSVVSSLTVLFVLTLFSGIVGVTYFGFHMRAQAIRADNNATRADRNAARERQARQTAEQRHYKALVSKTELFISTAGDELEWTWQALDDLRLASQLNVFNRDDATVRSLALRTMLSLDTRKLGSAGLVNDSALVADIAFSADGKTFFIAESKGIPKCFIVGFDTETLQETERYVLTMNVLDYASRFVRNSGEKFQQGFRTVAVSPDGRWLAGGTLFGRILVWDRTNPDAPPTIRSAHDEELFRLTFSPDGKLLYSSAKESKLEPGQIKVWKHSDT